MSIRKGRFSEKKNTSGSGSGSPKRSFSKNKKESKVIFRVRKDDDSKEKRNTERKSATFRDNKKPQRNFSKQGTDNFKAKKPRKYSTGHSRNQDKIDNDINNERNRPVRVSDNRDSRFDKGKKTHTGTTRPDYKSGTGKKFAGRFGVKSRRESKVVGEKTTYGKLATEKREGFDRKPGHPAGKGFKRPFDKKFESKPQTETKDKPERLPSGRPSRERKAEFDRKPERLVGKSFKKPFNNKEDKKPARDSQGRFERKFDKKALRDANKKTEARPNKLEKNAELIRLNRYVSNAGVCSRREADKLISTGLVSVNGKIITEMGYQVKPTDDVRFNGERLSTEKKVYVIMNKPKDAITTTDDPEGRNTVMDVLGNELSERVFPVGRLDRNTTGVLIFTNDGELATRLMHPKYEVEKVYKATLNKALKGEDLWQLKNGVELEDGFIKPDDIAFPDQKNKTEVGVQIHSGKNRIIHRIFEHLGYTVDKLDRASYAGFSKTKLKRGEWRFLDEKEIKQLKRAVKLA